MAQENERRFTAEALSMSYTPTYETQELWITWALERGGHNESVNKLTSQ